jgi:hypothetical protein
VDRAEKSRKAEEPEQPREQEEEPAQEQEEAAEPEAEQAAYITELDVDRLLRGFIDSGLDCERVGAPVLYTCTSTNNPDLLLLYEGELVGEDMDRVTHVEARLSEAGQGGDLPLSAESYFGYIAAVTDYRGGDSGAGQAFIEDSIGEVEASTTIGPVVWTLQGDADSRSLVLEPVSKYRLRSFIHPAA